MTSLKILAPVSTWTGPPQPISVAMKKGATSLDSLPAPLVAESIPKIMCELAAGSRRAVESCLECWKDKTLSNDDLLSFLRSISSQSATLSVLFAAKTEAKCEIASADDMAALRAMAAGVFHASMPRPAPKPTVVQVATPIVKRPLDTSEVAPASPKRTRTVLPDTMPVAAIQIDAPPDLPHAAATKQAPLKRTRRPKITDPTDEETRLMREWSERRVSEIARRQSETVGVSSSEDVASHKAAFMRFILTKLRHALPAEELPALLEQTRCFNAGTCSPDDLGAFIQTLVERHNIIVPLSFQEEVNVRPMPVSWRTSANGAKRVIYEDVMEEEGEETTCESAVCTSRGGVKGNDCCEDDDAKCPVCCSQPVEDERWVKCDGCSTWYHQICVLFNELAHGKSVRFFCRTPGCRKRGSRQLNRRQRKPCYPTSLSLETCPLSERVDAALVSVSRQDRSVVTRMVASAKHTRAGETLRSKTLMAFQHTMTGSDLLFMTVFIEEHGDRMDITAVDSNGLYEESYDGERAAVESAVFQGLMAHAQSAGFATVRLIPQGEDTQLFYARPSSGWRAGEAMSAFTRSAAAAKKDGVVSTCVRDGTGVVIVKIENCAGNVAESADMACKVACEREALLGLMQVNEYRFDTLQVAKFSSMMIVYHLAKGWKKEGQVMACSAMTRRGGAAMAESDEEAEEEEVPVPAKRAVRKTAAKTQVKQEASSAVKLMAAPVLRSFQGLHTGAKSDSFDANMLTNDWLEPVPRQPALTAAETKLASIDKLASMDGRLPQGLMDKLASMDKNASFSLDKNVSFSILDKGSSFLFEAPFEGGSASCAASFDVKHASFDVQMGGHITLQAFAASMDQDQYSEETFWDTIMISAEP